MAVAEWVLEFWAIMENTTRSGFRFPRSLGALLAGAAIITAAVISRSGPSAVEALDVVPVPEDVRAEFQLADFYQKYIELSGLPVVGSEQLSDAALLEAAWIVRNVLAEREDILEAMAGQHVRLAVMAWNEYTTDVPEHAHLEPAVFWDRRARGLGATPQAPAVSCAEENLLGHPGDPYATENILIHEFAHAIHMMGLNEVDPTFEPRLEAAWNAAREAGLWTGTYAITDPAEYWAEGVQSWFDDNRENDSLHNHVNTRSELREYDPALADLVEGVFGDRDWRYQKPAARNAAGRAHLVGWDPDVLPDFRWREYPITDRPKVVIDTAIGSITVELDAVNAPVTTENFLRYVLQGHYSDGEFFRTVTKDNQPNDSIRIAVIQAGANPALEKKAFAAIPLERTDKTGVRHLDGSISMARGAPDTATHSFFICVGDQPELDFGGERNPDGQGFAAFGRVVEGMDVVRRIHEMPAEGQIMKPPLPIQRAVRIH